MTFCPYCNGNGGVHDTAVAENKLGAVCPECGFQFDTGFDAGYLCEGGVYCDHGYDSTHWVES